MVDWDALIPEKQEVRSTKKKEDFIAIRKPKKTEFFRIRNDSAWERQHVPLYVSNGKDDEGEIVYVVTDAKVRDYLEESNGMLIYAHFYSALIRSTDNFLLTYIPEVRDATKAENKYHETRRRAYEHAKTQWVRMTTNMSLGVYEAHTPEEKLEEPEWPVFPATLREALDVAFGDKIISDMNHPEIRKLRGLK